MAQLCQHTAELAKLNTQVCVISFGATTLARAWLEETRTPFRFLLDPERSAYRAFGLEHSLARSWGLKVWWRYARLILAGHNWRGIQGDSGQLGGDFIIDSGGFIRFAHRSHDPTDRPAVSDLLRRLANYSGSNHTLEIER